MVEQQNVLNVGKTLLHRPAVSALVAPRNPCAERSSSTSLHSYPIPTKRDSYPIPTKRDSYLRGRWCNSKNRDWKGKKRNQDFAKKHNIVSSVIVVNTFGVELTFERKIVVGLEDIKAIRLHCLGCGRLMAFSPDQDVRLQAMCGCGKRWGKEEQPLTMRPVQEPYAPDALLSAIRDVRTLSKNGSMGVRIMFEFDEPVSEGHR